MDYEYLKICPRCGRTNFKIMQCNVCGCDMILTKYICDEYRDLIRNKSVEENRKFLRKLYNEYCYNSPAFSETEFQRREAEYDDMGYQFEEYQRKSDNTPKCPRCGSTNIQMVSRKWSLLTGFMTNKVDRVCVNCKHKF